MGFFRLGRRGIFELPSLPLTVVVIIATGVLIVSFFVFFALTKDGGASAVTVSSVVSGQDLDYSFNLFLRMPLPDKQLVADKFAGFCLGRVEASELSSLFRDRLRQEYLPGVTQTHIYLYYIGVQCPGQELVTVNTGFCFKKRELFLPVPGGDSLLIKYCRQEIKIGAGDR